MVRGLFTASVLGLALTLGAAATQAQPAAASPQRCFLASSWSGWKAAPDSKAIYIRVGVRRVFRLDLTAECPALQGVGVHLVTKLHGPWICHPLDLDLKVADGHGFATPCLVSKITELSAAEAAALPKDLQP